MMMMIIIMLVVVVVEEEELVYCARCDFNVMSRVASLAPCIGVETKAVYLYRTRDERSQPQT
jgi:hypothetical protein